MVDSDNLLGHVCLSSWLVAQPCCGIYRHFSVGSRLSQPQLVGTSWGVILVVVPLAFLGCFLIVGEWWQRVPLLGWHYWTVLTNKQTNKTNLNNSDILDGILNPSPLSLAKMQSSYTSEFTSAYIRSHSCSPAVAIAQVLYSCCSSKMAFSWQFLHNAYVQVSRKRPVQLDYNDFQCIKC